VASAPGGVEGRQGGGLSRGPGPVDRGPHAVTAEEARHARERREGCRERDGRWPDFEPRRRVEANVRSGRELVGQAVGHRHDERSAALRLDHVGQLDDLGALAGLAHDHHERSCAEDRAAEMEQLGRVHEDGGDTAPGEFVHCRIARIVGAPHPGEDDRRRQTAGLVDALELVPLLDQRGGGAPEPVRL
jgi:hypothetical protein